MAIKICHVTSVHPAKDDRIFFKECLSLTKEYEVYLIAPNVEDDTVDGVHILGVNLPKNRLKRFLSLDSVYEKALSVDASLYHFHDPELMYTGLKLKRKGKRVVFDSHEDVPMQILTKDYLPKIIRNIISFIYGKLEKIMLAKYDALVSVTPFIVERLSTINPNVCMITNYPVIGQITDKIRERLGDYVCFAGGVSRRYMHEYIIKSLEFTDVKYLLAGPADISYLKKLESLTQWKDVEYVGAVKYEDVNTIYSKAFAGIVLLDYSPNVGYHKGTLGVLKMFEYMLSGLPVIATDFELWKEIVEGNNCGKCINPYDIHAISETINFYKNNPKVAIEHGRNGRNAVLTKYNWETQERVLFKLYRTLIKT